MGTDNNIPLKGINNVFHSSLFEGISPVLIEFTVNLLNEHKSLFLFGTNGNKDLNEYSKELYEISKKEFSIINFEELIVKIRNHVSETVWSLIVEKYNLINEFIKLKEMFLIGRGELFATFLDSTKDLLNKPIEINFEYSKILIYLLGYYSRYNLK